MSGWGEWADVAAIVCATVYGYLLVAGVTNLTLMRRPRRFFVDGANIEILIPARNEERNLAKCIPPLVSAGAKVTVYDDESTDGTAGVAVRLGARVIPAEGTLPSGWTGKNRACHVLSLAATADWAVFLDADTIPSADFLHRLAAFLIAQPEEIQLVSGFPTLIPGRGLEPIYFGWVPWILLAAFPFGLVSRIGIGCNRFTNGQFDAWRRDVLLEIRPFEQLRSEVLEDVKIGRLMAKHRRRVEIVNVSDILSVRMYDTVWEAIDGMSKNSGDIADHPFGSFLVALFFLYLGWGWILGGRYWWALLIALVLGKFLTDRVIRYPAYTALFMPLTCTMACATIIRSLYWKRSGKVMWKGRTYS